MTGVQTCALPICLLEAAAARVKTVTEPQRIACGAPDFAVLRDGLMVGHVEAKDVDAVLDEAARSDQLTRYRRSLENLLLTNFIEFRWYVDGELAEKMARLTHLIREVIVAAFEQEEASANLVGMRNSFAEVLVAELERPENTGQFADMLAQTLAYGLFSARIRHTGGSFTRRHAQDLIPSTNPFLRDLFYYITGPQLDSEPYAGLVEDLVQVLSLAKMEAILEDFGKRNRQEDPVVHFYETFLAAYDPTLRELRGVYYTQMPIVSFIVRAVDGSNVTYDCDPDVLDLDVDESSDVQPAL